MQNFSNRKRNNYLFILFGNPLKKAATIIVLILIADQVLKIWVKTSMIIGSRGEIDMIGDWFILHFTENEGMAFGMKFGGDFG